jgi:tripartite-type tricarboxylate transporter receptor subunit TctC
VRIVIGFAGGLDAVARVVAEPLAALWGQPALVEAKAGAGGNIAAEMVARSAPDGYTVLMAGPPVAVSRFLYPSLAFDPAADFAPVSLVSLQPTVMVVPGSSPAHSVAEFVAHAKANPGKITYGSAGHGSSPHLCAELFKRETGIQMTHVPFSGAVPMGELIAGRIDVAFPTFAQAFPQVRAGLARALAIAWPKRIPAAPELPTYREAGLPALDEVSIWFGLFVPAKTSSEIIKRIQAGAVSALAEPAVKARLEQIGATPVGSTPAEFAAYFKAEMDRWGPVIKETKISINE